MGIGIGPIATSERNTTMRSKMFQPSAMYGLQHRRMGGGGVTVNSVPPCSAAQNANLLSAHAGRWGHLNQ